MLSILIAVANRSYNMFNKLLLFRKGSFFNQAGQPAAVLKHSMKLQKRMRNGFDFYFHLDRIYRIIRIFFACGEGLFGRRPHYPNDPACQGEALAKTG
jgi:hypothetical protein